MVQSVLSNVSLCYQALWNAQRACAGIRLHIDHANHHHVDAAQLLSALSQRWPHTAHPLLLSVRSAELLADILAQAPQPGLWIEIESTALEEAYLRERVSLAHQKGIHMVWRGAPGQAPTRATQAWFHKHLRTLTPEEALRALRTTARGTHSSPFIAGSMYDALATPKLVNLALDHHHVWAVLGWPSDEVLHSLRHTDMQPARQVLEMVIKAIDADASMDRIEQTMGQDPLLVYRFMRFANSAGLGLLRAIDSVRQGLMAIGYTPLRTWLQSQLAHGCTEKNLIPLRANAVWRARIMERLANAGAQENLRREVFTCGILAQIDALLNEPLPQALRRIPLPARSDAALLSQSGPYAAWLAIACALESNTPHRVQELCKRHKISLEEVNHALLHTLGAPPHLDAPQHFAPIAVAAPPVHTPTAQTPAHPHYWG